MEFQEFPKWVYPAGIKDEYRDGEEPYIVESPDQEQPAPPKRRGRPPKVAEAE